MEEMSMRKEDRSMDDEAVVGCLEIFSSTGKVAQRITLKNRAVRIGRGYDNDVVIDDPYISPHHLRIYPRDSDLYIEDTDSLNGIVLVDKKERVKSFKAETGLRFKVGRTLMRFCGKDFPVADTLKDRTSISLYNYMENPIVSIFLTIAAAAYIGLDIYIGITDKNDEIKMVGGFIFAVVLTSVWSTIWSFASRIVLHRWNFIIHCGTASLGLLLMSITGDLISYSSFALELDQYSWPVNIAAFSILSAFLIYSHLRLVSLSAPSRLIGISVGVTALMTGTVVILMMMNERNFNPAPAYSMTIKPPIFRFTKGKTPDAFFNDGDNLLTKINDMKKREIKNR